MKQIQVKWNKVCPADLSSTANAHFFAFSKNKEVILVEEVGNGCLFTKIIQTAANLNRSIYEMEIWVGSIQGGLNTSVSNYNRGLLMDALEWSAKVQMNEEATIQIKMKELENNKISKRTRLRMLASIA